MCGIFGIHNIKKNREISLEKVRNAAAKMWHRGPDNFTTEIINPNTAFSHLRLAIIDLNPESNQPMHLDNNNYTVVFNGEIYNYIEIKVELEALGCTFHTSSDTEVLLMSYKIWGTSCVQRFNGMWAFSIYDKQQDLLFCSRDRFGVKPFNYAVHEGQFIFASEIKSILDYAPAFKKPHYNVIANYIYWSLGAQNEQTWFDGVKRLQAGHNLVIQNGQIQIDRYWFYPEKEIKIDFEEARTTYRDLFMDAVKLRMRSDVTVGTTLSAGLDSNSIVYALRTFYKGDHDIFTAVTDDKKFFKEEKEVYNSTIVINEETIARHTAKDLNLKAHIITVNNEKFLHDLKGLIYHLESGHASPAIVPLSQILEPAKKSVTVLLEGQGADELLAGYTVNDLFYHLGDLLRHGELNDIVKEIKSFQQNYKLSYAFKMYLRQSENNLIKNIYLQRAGLDKILGYKLKPMTLLSDYNCDAPSAKSRLNRSLIREHSGGLISLLHYGDAISMKYALESRLPFMDYRLVEFATQLPGHFKMKDGYGKYIHRQAVKDFVPDDICFTRMKYGFSTSLNALYEAAISGALNVEHWHTVKAGILSKEGILLLINSPHLKNNLRLLYRLVSVEYWYATFITEDTPSV